LGQAEEGEKLRGKCRKRRVNSKLVEIINRHDCWSLELLKGKTEKQGNGTAFRGFSTCNEKRAKEIARDRSNTEVLEWVLHKTADWSDQHSWW